MELFADGKGLIINEGKNATTRQWRTAMLLHLTGPHVQDIFSKLVNTGKANNHISAAVTALGKWIFSSQSQLTFCPSEIWPTPTKARWDIFGVCIELKKKRKIWQFWCRLQQSDKRPCPVQMWVRLCKPQIIWRKVRANPHLDVRTPRTVWKGRAPDILSQYE